MVPIWQVEPLIHNLQYTVCIFNTNQSPSLQTIDRVTKKRSSGGCMVVEGKSINMDLKHVHKLFKLLFHWPQFFPSSTSSTLLGKSMLCLSRSIPLFLPPFYTFPGFPFFCFTIVSFIPPLLSPLFFFFVFSFLTLSPVLSCSSSSFFLFCRASRCPNRAATKLSPQTIFWR